MVLDPRCLAEMAELLQTLGVDAESAEPARTDESEGIRIAGRCRLEVHAVRDDVLTASYQRGEPIGQLVRRLAARHVSAGEISGGDGWADAMWSANDPDRARCYGARDGMVVWVEVTGRDVDDASAIARDALRIAMMHDAPLT